MTDYRDAAVAEHQWKLDQAAAAEQAAEDDLVAAARLALTPLVTTHDGKTVLTLDKWTPDLVDVDNGLVVLTAADGSGVSFGVHPYRERGTCWLVRQVAGAWERVAPVADLDDVGAALAGSDGT